MPRKYRPTLAELHVGFGSNGRVSLAPEFRKWSAALALLHRLATLQQQGAESPFGANSSGSKVAAGPSPDTIGPQGRCRRLAPCMATNRLGRVRTGLSWEVARKQLRIPDSGSRQLGSRL